MRERLSGGLKNTKEIAKAAGILTMAPFIVIAAVGIAGVTGTLDYISDRRREYAENKKSSRMLSTAVLFPLETAIATYEGTQSISMAVAAGTATLVAETLAIGIFIGQH